MLLYDDVIGLVTRHIPVLGLIGAYFSTSAGKLVLFELLVIGILLHIVADRIKV